MLGATAAVTAAQVQTPRGSGLACLSPGFPGDGLSLEAGPFESKALWFKNTSFSSPPSFRCDVSFTPGSGGFLVILCCD